MKKGDSAKRAEILKLISEHKKEDEIQWIRTGIHAIDLLVGNGIPMNKVIEIFGSEASGKSLLAWTIAKAFQKVGGVVVLYDVEGTAPKEWMRKLGIDTKLFMEPLEYPKTVEEIRDSIRETVNSIRKIDKDVPTLIILDSIAACTSNGEWEDVKELKPKINIGARAKSFSEFFRQFSQFLSENDVTLVCVNQIRDKIGVMWGKKEESPGGKALKFQASIRLEINSGAGIKDKDNNVIGVYAKIKTEKNKCAPPLRSIKEAAIYWDRGYDEYGGLLEVLEKTGRVKIGERGSFSVGDKNYKSIEKAIEENPELIKEWIYESKSKTNDHSEVGISGSDVDRHESET